VLRWYHIFLIAVVSLAVVLFALEGIFRIL
jgi:hypothetical protein